MRDSKGGSEEDLDRKVPRIIEITVQLKECNKKIVTVNVGDFYAFTRNLDMQKYEELN